MQAWRPSRLPLPLPPRAPLSHPYIVLHFHCFKSLSIVLLFLFKIYLFIFFRFCSVSTQVFIIINIIIIQTRTFLEVKGGYYEITTTDNRDEPCLNEGHIFTLFVRPKGNLFSFSWRIIALQCCDVSSVCQCEPALSTQLSPPTSPLQVVTEPRLRVPCITHHTPSGDLFYVW